MISELLNNRNLRLNLRVIKLSIVGLNLPESRFLLFLTVLSKPELISEQLLISEQC